MKKVILILVIMLLTGCNESQKWGNGDPPAEYIEKFGNDNSARLAWVHDQNYIKLYTVVHGLDTTKDGKTTHTPGVVDYLVNFDSRIKALEDPNEVWQENMEGRLGNLERDITVTEYSTRIGNVTYYKQKDTAEEEKWAESKKVEEEPLCLMGVCASCDVHWKVDESADCEVYRVMDIYCKKHDSTRYYDNLY